MEDPELVRVLEPAADLQQQRQSLAEGERAGAVDPVVQRLARAATA